MCLDIIKHYVGLFNKCINRKGNLKKLFHKKKKRKNHNLNSGTYNLGINVNFFVSNALNIAIINIMPFLKTPNFHIFIFPKYRTT